MWGLCGVQQARWVEATVRGCAVTPQGLWWDDHIQRRLLLHAGRQGERARVRGTGVALVEK